LLVLVLLNGVMGVWSISGCGFGDIDLTSLDSSTDLSYSDNTFTYFMNMCGVVHNSACTAAKPGVMVCQTVTSGTPPDIYALAYFQLNGQLGGVWSYLNGNSSNGVQAVYTNGDGDCYNGGQKEDRQITMSFPCQATADATFAFATSSTDGCHYTLTYGTPAACPGNSGGSSSSSSSLSGGWIFVIVLLVSFVLYVVLGCLYKSQKLGATGMERCPNVDFWRDLPGLVKDGAVFLFRKCKSLCSSSGGDTYQNL